MLKPKITFAVVTVWWDGEECISSDGEFLAQYKSKSKALRRAKEWNLRRPGEQVKKYRVAKLIETEVAR